MDYRVNINGIDVEAHYRDEDVENIFIPLLEKIREIERQSEERVIVFMAAPPGAGKSTLASFLQHLSVERGLIGDMQIIGMDGFHRRQEFLKSHYVTRDGREVLMVDIKGAPETFDLEMLRARLMEVASGKECGWPEYNRQLHDAVDNVIRVTANVVLVEGNYLLLQETGWKELSGMADYTIFIRADEDMLRKRLVARRIESGHDENEAESFVERSDMYNARTILRDSKTADLTLQLNSDGSYSVGDRII